MSRLIYKDYIVSSEWRSRHPAFLRQSHYRCALLPWVKVGKGHKYNCHHMNYRHLGDEQLWRDVVVLCPFAHSFIIHGILSGFKRPKEQRSYPNAAQKVAHFWCTMPVALRASLILLALVNVLKALW